MKNLQTDRVKWYEDSDGAWLCIKARPSEVRAVCDSVSDGKKYDVTIKQHRERRSLDANAYFWVLAGKLAAKLSMPGVPVTPDMVYREYIKDVADNFEIVPVREDRIEAWCHVWCSGHIGRMAEVIGPCRKTEGYFNVRCYLGSSDYDTAQMSRLIDLIVEDCKAQGIETMTPIELERLKEEWR